MQSHLYEPKVLLTGWTQLRRCLMVSNNQSCYDHNMFLVPSTPHCDYSTSFRCAIRERTLCFPVFNTYCRHWQRITLISEEETKVRKGGKISSAGNHPVLQWKHRISNQTELHVPYIPAAIPWFRPLLPYITEHIRAYSKVSRSYGICGRSSVNRKGISWSTSFFRSHYYSNIAPYLFIYLPPTLNRVALRPFWHLRCL